MHLTLHKGKITMEENFLRNSKYMCSARLVSQFPSDSGLEIAFAGRSNAGKSSAINAVCDHKKLAHTAKQPGRTREVNFFHVQEGLRLVDLPGYGYAKVERKTKDQWNDTLYTYLTEREALKGIILLMDIRHTLTKNDIEFLDMIRPLQINCRIVLTKADKLSKGKASSSLQITRNWCKKNLPYSTVQLMSSLKKTGLKELSEYIKMFL